MKSRTAKAAIWLVALVTTATAAAAQISPAPAFSGIRGYMSGTARTLLATTAPQAELRPVSAAEASLPDAPSAIGDKQAPQEIHSEPAQPPLRGIVSRPAGATFLAANGALLGSTIANVEMIARCRPSSCQSVPDAIRSRGALYGIGIPSSLAVSYVSYRLKRSGTKVWILPVVAFTAGNIVYAVHASHFSR
jgi:hypothetical protein